MALYREGRLNEAGELLFRNNPLSAITSRVCDWRDFCYGHCVLNVKKIAVRWYEIEQEVSDLYLKTAKLERLPEGRLNGRKVSIVGGGPGGIAAAVFLFREGADVTICDSRKRMGGVLRYGIPPFRLDKSYIDSYESLLTDAGVVFKGRCKAGRDISLKELSEASDAVILACGAEKPVRLGIEGEDSPMVMDALQYLSDPGSFTIGPEVIVIGGGNVAMDVARTAARRGISTTIFYRKTFGNMPASPVEVEHAQLEGVRFRVFEAPVKIGDGKVTFRDCENITDPSTGKLLTRIIPGTDHDVRCDTLIPAISERPDFSLFRDMPPIFNQFGFPLTDKSTSNISFMEGGPRNIFACGDFILGPKTVVEAVSSAKKAVEGIITVLK
jgi:glutamate synthase (NADPH/NADH) small chain